MSIGYAKYLQYFKIQEITCVTQKTACFEYVIRLYPNDTWIYPQPITGRPKREAQAEHKHQFHTGHWKGRDTNRTQAPPPHRTPKTGRHGRRRYLQLPDKQNHRCCLCHCVIFWNAFSSASDCPRKDRFADFDYFIFSIGLKC